MPRAPYRPKQLQFQLFRGTQAVDDAVLTPTQLRSSAWVRLGRDVYADSRLDRDHELACRAAALRLPDYVAFAGPSAAALLGVRHAADFSDPVHVVVADTVRLGNSRGLLVHRVALNPTDIDASGDLRRTSPERTVWDLASWLDLVRSVPIIDGMLADGAITVDALTRYAASRRPRRGLRRTLRAIELADGRAQSPQESRLRVRLVLAGLPVPESQFGVVVGSYVLHPDLAWPEFKVAVEYDGAWHADADQLHRDRRRLNKLVAAGWIVLHVTSERLRRDFVGVLTEIRSALKSRGWPG